MTTCSTSECGTGLGSIIRPDDPSNNSILTATPAFGGVDVTWTLPATNPHAVSYVRVWRGILPNFNSAIVVANVGGNIYYDKTITNLSIEYYYWIQLISINGTEGELIGPASAVARPLIDDVIIGLTDKIDRGVLSMSLKADIDRITLNYAELTDEIANRVSSNQYLSAAIAQVQNGTDDAIALVNSEIINRQEGDSALVTQLNTVAALNAQNAAAILSETTARVDGDSALAQSITTVTATVNGKNRTYSQATAPSTGLVVGDIWYKTSDNNKAHRWSGTAWIETSDTRIATTASSLTTEQTTRANADTALATQITTAQSTAASNLASAQTTLQTNIDTVNGKVASIGALYTAKVTVNGLVGGFGIYNDGTTVEAGFDVDTFWVGKTSTNKKKPFIISGGEVFINEAVIGTATIDFAKINKATIQNLSAITQNVGQISMVRTPTEATFIRYGKTSINDATNAGFWIGVDASGVAGVAIGGLNGLFKYSAADGLQVAGQSVSVVQPGSIVASGAVPQTFNWTNNTGLYTSFSIKMIGGGGGGGSIDGGSGVSNGTAGGNTVATVKNASGSVIGTYTATGGSGGTGKVAGSSQPDPPDIIRRSPVLISTEDGAAGGGGWFYYFGTAANSGAVGAYTTQTITVPLGGSVSVTVGAGGLVTGSAVTYAYRGSGGYSGAFILSVVGA